MNISGGIGGSGRRGFGAKSYSLELTGGMLSGLSHMEMRPRRMFQRLNCGYVSIRMLGDVGDGLRV